MNARARIVARLYESDKHLAVHELKVMGVSDNAAATRLSELAKDGIVEGRVRAGFKFKEWRLRPAELTLPLTVVGQ